VGCARHASWRNEPFVMADGGHGQRGRMASTTTSPALWRWKASPAGRCLRHRGLARPRAGEPPVVLLTVDQREKLAVLVVHKRCRDLGDHAPKVRLWTSSLCPGNLRGGEGRAPGELLKTRAPIRSLTIGNAAGSVIYIICIDGSREDSFKIHSVFPPAGS
jgi:hypothetical protein